MTVTSLGQLNHEDVVTSTHQIRGSNAEVFGAQLEHQTAYQYKEKVIDKNKNVHNFDENSWQTLHSDAAHTKKELRNCLKRFKFCRCY